MQQYKQGILMLLVTRLRLKTILSLIPDKLMPEMQEFCEENNINLLHLTVDKMKEDNIPLTYNKTLMALQVKNNKKIDTHMESIACSYNVFY